MRFRSFLSLVVAAMLTASLFASTPANAQSIDWYGECPEPGFGATCDSDGTRAETDLRGVAADYECENTDLDSIQTEYHRAVGAFVQESAGDRYLDSMLWLGRVLTLQAHWDDWHYWCSGEHYSMRPLLQMTLEDDLAERFAVEYEKYYPRRYVEPADIITGSG